ncbi:MAG: uroporphyrinogen-III synthase [Propionibacteriaceae bacterium]
MNESKIEDVAASVNRARVIFVGTGPGDPDLLTLAAVSKMSTADVILLNHEGRRELFEHPAVNLKDTVKIESIDGLAGPEARAEKIVAFVEEGVRVVRLVTGDPFLDGNVADEAAACVKLGVDFEVVPGISSLTAVPEYAGIPLEDSEGIHFVNAMDGRFSAEGARRWSDIGTVVVSTRARYASHFVEAAKGAGRGVNDPVVLTFRGGSTEQASRTTTLGRICDTMAASRVADRDHIHIMLGNVAKISDELNWFEAKPLFGWRVLLPKTKDNTTAMRERLHGYGANSEEVPTICVEPPRTPQQIDKAIRGLVEGRYEWVAFTSESTVRAIKEKFEQYGLDARAFSGLRVAAVSRATAAALQAWGIEADLIPDGEQNAQGLADEFPCFDPDLDPINRVFLPRADIATENLAAALTELGWEVEDVVAYRTVRAAPPPADTREAIKTGKFDAVVFTSSSTVRNLVGIAGKPHQTTVVAAIGPATAKTCEEHGLRVDVIAPSPNLDVLTDALAAFAAQRRAAIAEKGDPFYKPSQRRPGSRRRSS